MRIIHIFFLFHLGFSANLIFAQAADGVQDKIQKFETYHQENYLEIVYIHPDKRYYLTGERLMFKVYCLEKLSTKPSALSKVAYVEVLDQDNVPKLQSKIELQDGSGYGEMYIPTDLGSGNYILRGYTRWMKNYGPETFFHAVLPIINPFRKLESLPEIANTTYTLNFYPESNVLIHGVPTKIVFEAKSADSHAFDFNGRLIANDSILIRAFQSTANGIGSFYFTPDTLKTYRAEILHSDSSITRHSFPAVQKEGLSLQVTEASPGFKLDIFCNDLTMVQPSEYLYFLVYQKGKILEANTFALSNSTYSTEINNLSIEEGILNVALFNSSGTLLRERRVFVCPKSARSPHVNMDKNSYTQRGRVLIDIQGMEKVHHEVAEASISVASNHPEFDSHYLGLQDYLLLENSLTAFPHYLEPCFNGSISETSQSINNMLIAYSEPGEKWQYEISREPMKDIAEFRGPLIAGTIRNKLSKEPAIGIFTYLSVPGKNVQFYTTKSKRDGSIIFELKDFYGSNEIVVQNDYTRDTLYTIDIDNPFSQDYVDIEVPTFHLGQHIEDWLKRRSQNMQVENAYLKYQAKLPLLNTVDSSSFFNEPDSRYYLDDYTRFTVMEEVMREYVSGVNVRKNRNGFHFMVVDLDRNVIYDENPLMLVDGVPVFDADEIIEMDPLKIKKIETVKKRFHKGYLDCKGIVSYMTYDGNLDGYSLNKDALVFKYDGVQPKKQYYFPTYRSDFDRRSRTPDFRNTLYWDPQLISGKNRDMIIEFFTSDDAGSYEIRINGVSKNGTVFSSKAYFTVSSADN